MASSLQDFFYTILNPKEGVCVLKSDKINGVVYFKENSDGTVIYGKVSGLTPFKKHGFHIHESGDLTDGCASACAVRKVQNGFFQDS